jgi:hypothetical protein
MLYKETAVAAFNEMRTAKVVDMMGAMDVAKASDIWGDMEPVKAGAVMEDVPVDTADEIVKLVSEDRLVARLPEMSAQKLWDLPLELLLRKPPSVDAMQLDFWNRPEVASDLPDPVATTTTDSRSVYVLPETRESEWALVVASPAPFQKVWAKFTRHLSDVRIVVESLPGRPEGTPELLPGRVANAFIQSNLQGTLEQDIQVAAAIAFVDKSWLDAN